VSTTSVTRTGSPRRSLGDLVFSGAAFSAAMVILVALAGVAIFLVIQGVPALGADPSDLNGKPNLLAYTAPLVFGTLWAALIAILIATPLALGVALAVSHYAPKRLAVPLGYLVDLLAAVPSVVYGLWGIGFLGPRLVPAYEWLDQHLGWVPLFAGPASTTGRTILTAGIVLAIMILPIITAISREIFSQTPRLNEEAALALGATRWEMVRLSVLPYARSGIVSAVMLGLGRAMGETMAVAMVLSASGVVTLNLISSTNPSTIAANIALTFADATGLKVNALVATGLVLFVITFVVNFAARAIVARADRSVSR
jgi:phosphate transport system permease protein